MTAKHLPPDTGREISSLKRRVSDLERMLDRMRRLKTTTPANTFDTPYAQLEGRNEATLIAPGETEMLTPNRAAVLDPTGHVFVDFEDDTHGWFVFRKPGYYEVGGTVRFNDNECTDDGDRWLSIYNTGPDAVIGASLPVLRVDRAAGGSLLSGSRMLYTDASHADRWHLAAGHDDDHDLYAQCESFWTRFVTSGDPPPFVGSA